MDDKLTGLNCNRIEVDEMCGFIGMKQKNTKRNGVADAFGDIWTWIALVRDTKLVPTFATEDRSSYMCDCFMADLAKRLNNRVHITSDALSSYVDAIERAFGSEVDYASLVKTCSDPAPAEARRYSPPQVTGIRKKVLHGAPDKDLISTSYLEKQDHTAPRMRNRRLSRFTIAFSQKRENFGAAVALHFGYYSFVKSHGTVKMTPAMAASVTDSFWTVDDLVEMIEG